MGHTKESAARLKEQGFYAMIGRRGGKKSKRKKNSDKSPLPQMPQ